MSRSLFRNPDHIQHANFFLIHESTSEIASEVLFLQSSPNRGFTMVVRLQSNVRFHHIPALALKNHLRY